MKFGYDGADLSELIEKYEVSFDGITIHFLDGSYYRQKYTPENIQKLNSLMLVQAINRRDNIVLNDLIKEWEEKKKISFGTAIICGLSCGSILITEELFYIAIYLISASLSGGFCLRFSKQNKELKEKIEELEKYEIFLSIKEEIENNIHNSNLFNEVQNELKLIDINSLDDCSLEDVKQIDCNLKKIRRYR